MALDATARSASQSTPDAAAPSRIFKAAFKYGLLFAGIAALGATATALGNYVLNPLIYNHSQQIAAAVAMADHHGIAMADTNVDWRDVRREHVLRMKETPDLVIFGGSRWQEATSEVAPGRRVYNSFVFDDQLEDMMALTELFYEAHRLPKTLVLSVRVSTFQNVDRWDSSWWKSFGPEYRRMAERLGVEPYSWIDTLPIGKWLNLLSLDALIGKARQYEELHTLWQVTDAPSDADLDVVGADGGLRFSGRHLKMMSAAYAQENAITTAAFHRVARLKADPARVAQLGRLIAFLHDQGVNVIFAQTPLHPAYFASVEGTPFYEDLLRIQAELDGLALASGAVAIAGGFDPAHQGCAEADFRDFSHARVQCLIGIVARSLE